jgi:C-terminal processing protease CtpA/Prc
VNLIQIISGDIITAVDGKSVKAGVSDVLGCIGLEIGKSIAFTVQRRQGGEKTITIITTADLSRRQKK